MTINVIQGDLIEDVVKNKIQGHIIHGCNTKGSMGAGIAAQVKRKIPDAYNAYMDVHNSQGLALGQAISAQIRQDTVFWNILSQQDTGRDPNVRYVSYDGIDLALSAMRNKIEAIADDAIPNKLYFPLIGCGLANGKWSVISSIIEEHFGDFELFLYEYVANR